MKIRSDFVTNSSSTAFILIRRATLTPEGIRRLLGMQEDSPLAPIADVLCERLEEYGRPIDGVVNAIASHENCIADTARHVNENFSEEVARKVAIAKAAGHSIEMGKLSSDVDEIESFLCCESFELENDEYYLNAVACYW